jgi:hypothetical protein
MAALPEPNPYEPPKAPIERLTEPPGRYAAPGRAGPPAAVFEIACACGRTHQVKPSQAGSTVRCDCGNEVAVPSLSRLREATGRRRYESGPADTIRRMIETGELPSGTACAYSRTPTDDILDFQVVLPRFFLTEDARQGGRFPVFNILTALIDSILNDPVIAAAGVVTLVAPLRVASRWHAKVSGDEPASPEAAAPHGADLPPIARREPVRPGRRKRAACEVAAV